MKILLTDSPKSDLLKQKFFYLFYVEANGAIKNTKDEIYKFYEQNQKLAYWLNWKKSDDKKILFALEMRFEDYVVWNFEIIKQKIRQNSSGSLLYSACKGGSRNLVDLIIKERESSKIIEFENYFNFGLVFHISFSPQYCYFFIIFPFLITCSSALEFLLSIIPPLCSINSFSHFYSKILT